MVVTDGDYRFWLKAFGVTVPQGKSAWSVAASGLPPALAALAKDFVAESE